MRDRELTDLNVEAFDEWAATGEAQLWDITVADGLDKDTKRGDAAGTPLIDEERHLDGLPRPGAPVDYTQHDRCQFD
jgi:hypothetical protein